MKRKKRVFIFPALLYQVMGLNNNNVCRMSTHSYYTMFHQSSTHLSHYTFYPYLYYDRCNHDV